MQDTVQKDAIGLRIDLTIKEDGVAFPLTTASTKNYIILKPDGTTVLTVAASFITDGSDGRLRYSTVAGDLNQLGKYQIQVYLAFPSGYIGPTEIGHFWVNKNIN